MSNVNQWRDYILASVFGALIVLQFTLIFFVDIDGIQAVRYIGWVVWAAAIVFGWMPIFVLRRKGGVPKGESYVHTTVLVDTGIYAVVRHPQFLAGILLSLALMLVAQHWLVIVIGIAAMVAMYVDVLRIDRRDIDKFGDEYTRYMHSVPRLNVLVGVIRLLQRRKEIRLETTRHGP